MRRWEGNECNHLIRPAPHVKRGTANPDLRPAALARCLYHLPQSIEIFTHRNRPVTFITEQRLGARTEWPKRECHAPQVTPSRHNLEERLAKSRMQSSPPNKE
jgi:hypothetical protein